MGGKSRRGGRKCKVGGERICRWEVRGSGKRINRWDVSVGLYILSDYRMRAGEDYFYEFAYRNI